MLFSEVYGSYYKAVSSVLECAVKDNLTGRKLTQIVRKEAFGESTLTIPEAMQDGNWGLLESDYRTPIRNIPTKPLTILEKRWLKALLSDPRIKLFNPDTSGLADVKPLYDQGTFVYFDRYEDGDPYQDEKYIEHFRTILTAMKTKRKIRVRFQGRRETRHVFVCIPYHLEYSPKDDKFRLITFFKGNLMTVNIGRIHSVKMMEEYTEEEFCPAALRERSLVLELTDDRNALERAMLHFSDLEKETVKIDRKHYRITIWYKKDDETEILIRILSFGPVLKVVEPAAMVDQIVQRLDRQLLYGNLVDCT